MKKIYILNIIFITMIMFSSCTNMITPQPDCFTVKSSNGETVVICN